MCSSKRRGAQAGPAGRRRGSSLGAGSAVSGGAGLWRGQSGRPCGAKWCGRRPGRASLTPDPRTGRPGAESPAPHGAGGTGGLGRGAPASCRPHCAPGRPATSPHTFRLRRAPSFSFESRPCASPLPHAPSPPPFASLPSPPRPRWRCGLHCQSHFAPPRSLCGVTGGGAGGHRRREVWPQEVNGGRAQFRPWGLLMCPGGPQAAPGWGRPCALSVALSEPCLPPRSPP